MWWSPVVLECKQKLCPTMLKRSVRFRCDRLILKGVTKWWGEIIAKELDKVRRNMVGKSKLRSAEIRTLSTVSNSKKMHQSNNKSTSMFRTFAPTQLPIRDRATQLVQWRQRTQSFWQINPLGRLFNRPFDVGLMIKTHYTDKPPNLN